MKTLKKGILFIFAGLLVASCKHDDLDDSQMPVQIDYHQTAKTQFITGGGNNYAYRILGNQEGTPLVMLSSLGSSMDDWDPAVTNGLAQKFKVIIFDNVGVGLSKGKTPDTIGEMAKDATEFIKALGYDKVNIMGFSMGAFIAEQIALNKTGLIGKIILTGSGPKGAIGLSDLPKILASASDLSPEETFIKFGFASSEKSMAAGKNSYERIHKRTVERDLPLSNESSIAQLTAVLGWAQPDPNALTELKSVDNSVLIVHGENDLPVQVVNAINLSKSFPNSKLTVYPDSGHAAIFQNHEAFVSEAIDFLGE